MCSRCDILLSQFVHADLLSLIRFDFCHFKPREDESFHLLCGESEFHFTSQHAFIFTHAKTTQIHSPSICILSIGAQHPHSHMPRRDLHKRRRKKERGEKNSKMMNLWRDCSRLSRHEWARVTLPQAVCHPSVARWHPRCLCLRLMFSPHSWWAAMAGSVKCTRLPRHSADGDLSPHRRAS